ncbi:MAG: hypothetical protein WCF84_26690 [Anaerolineae bacterium]
MQVLRILRAIGILFLALVAVGGCGPRPLLTNVSLAPTTISPFPGSKTTATLFQYSLTRTATVSVYLVDTQRNIQYTLRENQVRAADDYQILFGGAVNDRILPDGVYQVLVQAREGNGPVEEARNTLTITNADTTLPELKNFTVFPDHFTPNQDGIDDRVLIAYELAKPARVEVYLTDGKNKYPIDEKKETTILTEDKLSAPGRHEYDYDGGIDRGAAPPPDGNYTVVAEAVDAIGNIVRVEHPLTIQDGGTPRAAIIGSAGEFTPQVIPLGSTMQFTVTIKNIGTVPIRTTGPEPGFIYSTDQNYSIIQQYEEPGVWRIGVDSEGNSIGRQYPYRWQLGSSKELKHVTINGKEYLYLMPGQVVVVTGGIKITDKPPKVNPYYWLGLIQEQVRIVQDHIQPTQITVDF